MQLPQVIMPAVDFANALVIYGPMGIMLAWFMWVHGRHIRSLTNSINGMQRAMLMDMLSRDNIGTNTRKQAEKMISKLRTGDTFDGAEE